MAMYYFCAQTNVVKTQPTFVVVKGKSKELQFGVGAIVFAAVSTFCISFCLCWWALPCAIVGVVLGVTVSFFCVFVVSFFSYKDFCQLCCSDFYMWFCSGCYVTTIIKWEK